MSEIKDIIQKSIFGKDEVVTSKDPAKSRHVLFKDKEDMDQFTQKTQARNQELRKSNYPNESGRFYTHTNASDREGE